MSKLYTIEAKVHMELAKGYRVKLSILSLGIYVNGMVVFPPNEERNYWAVFEPAQRNKFGKFFKTVEFDHRTPLWKEICEVCVEAVQLYISESKDVVITDFDIDAPINFDDIPF